MIVLTYILVVLLAGAVTYLLWADHKHRHWAQEVNKVVGQHGNAVQGLADQLRAIADQAATPAPVAPVEPSPTDTMMTKLIDRLLDAALPERLDEPRDQGEVIDGRSDAEYEPPTRDVSDWTDPFFGLERDVVGGLAPGQAIPGIGTDDDRMDHAPDHDWTMPEDHGASSEAMDALFGTWDQTTARATGERLSDG